MEQPSFFDYERIIAQTAQANKDKTSTINKLVVFDFDSTLFKSPMPNPNLWSSKLVGTIISDCQWFSEPRTLQNPYVPAVPGPEWWNLDVVEEARKSLTESDTLTVLMTGRRRDLFYDRIKDICLLQTEPLPFHFFFLKEVSDNTGSRVHQTTLDYKFAVLKCLLDHFPHIQHVELFDDRHQHVNLFSKSFSDLQERGRIKSQKIHHIVTGKHLEMYMPSDLESALVRELVKICNDKIVACAARNSPRVSNSIPSRISRRTSTNTKNDSLTKIETVDDMGDRLPRRISISMFRNEIELIDRVTFTALFLTADSKSILQKQFSCPTGWSSLMEHMIVWNGGENESMIEELGGIGTSHTLTGTHIGSIDGKCYALKIDPTNLISGSKIMHITLFVSHTGHSRQANDIENWIPLDRQLKLEGILGVKRCIGMKSEIHQPVSPLPLSIGKIVLKHFPHLVGKEIGKVVRLVHDWMSKSFVENSEQNRATVEFFIQQIDISKLSEVPDLTQTIANLMNIKDD